MAVQAMRSPPELHLVDACYPAADLSQLRHVRVDLIGRHLIPCSQASWVHGRCGPEVECGSTGVRGERRAGSYAVRGRLNSVERGPRKSGMTWRSSARFRASEAR